MEDAKGHRLSRMATKRNGRAKVGQTAPRDGKGDRTAGRQGSAERIFADNSLAIELFGLAPRQFDPDRTDARGASNGSR